MNPVINIILQKDIIFFQMFICIQQFGDQKFGIANRKKIGKTGKRKGNIIRGENRKKLILEKIY